MSTEPTSISFRQCNAGSHNDYPAAQTLNATNLCIPCQPGFSTSNGTDQPTCVGCPVGSYADRSGMAACLPCPRGEFAPVINSTACSPCSLNSWQHAEGQGRCDACDLGTYIQYREADQASEVRSDATCLPCPFLSRCDANGSIDAMRGAYLIIDQSSHAVRSVPCSGTACVGLGSTSRTPTAPQLISVSLLPVSNWCGSNRWPAFDPTVPALAATLGHNVLATDTTQTLTAPHTRASSPHPSHIPEYLTLSPCDPPVPFVSCRSSAPAASPITPKSMECACGVSR
jgi:hypothetical protein